MEGHQQQAETQRRAISDAQSATGGQVYNVQLRIKTMIG